MDVTQDPADAWVRPPAEPASPTVERPPEPDPVAPGIQLRPHPDAVAPPTRALPVSTPVDVHCRWWWLGCHGGAGASTLAASSPGSADACGLWPAPAPQSAPSRVVLVTRTHAAGLTAAQNVLRQWAARTLPPSIELLGLVFVADVPGRLPRVLQDVQRLISGGAPRTWSLPWHEPWRLGQPPAHTSPRQLASLNRELTRLTETGDQYRV